MVLPSHSRGSVGGTPSGAAHSTMFTDEVATNRLLAGMTTLICCPLENGVPAVNGAMGTVASRTVEPCVGSAALEMVMAPSAAPAVTSTPAAPATSRFLVLDIQYVPFLRQARPPQHAR